MALNGLLERIKLGFTPQEYEKYVKNLGLILTRDAPFREFFSTQPDYKPGDLEEKIAMGIQRDIQAQRLPPNVKVPSRRKPLAYLKTVYGQTHNLPVTLRSYLSSGSWTSSGGSFKLAEETGYDITRMMLDIEQKKGHAKLLEIGAGYAGFKTEEPKGIRKLVEKAKEKMGKTITADFTNLSNWHQTLPDGVTEHPGYLARNIASVPIVGADIIYSQCAAYFEQKPFEFVAGAAFILNKNGYLIFNTPTLKVEEVKRAANKTGLMYELEREFGGENGTLLIFKKA